MNKQEAKKRLDNIVVTITDLQEEADRLRAIIIAPPEEIEWPKLRKIGYFDFVIKDQLAIELHDSRQIDSSYTKAQIYMVARAIEILGPNDLGVGGICRDMLSLLERNIGGCPAVDSAKAMLNYIKYGKTGKK